MFIEILIYAIGYYVTTFGGYYLVKSVLSHFQGLTPSDEGLRQAGAAIGVLERLLAVTLVYSNQFTAILILFTAKSIIRFPEAREGRKFAEYYLIGTLTSLLTAILVGITINYIIQTAL